MGLKYDERNDPLCKGIINLQRHKVVVKVGLERSQYYHASCAKRRLGVSPRRTISQKPSARERIQNHGKFRLLKWEKGRY